MAAVVSRHLSTDWRPASGELRRSTAFLNARGQFEPVIARVEWRLAQLVARIGRSRMARIDTIINLTLDGRLPDPTNGAKVLPKSFHRRSAGTHLGSTIACFAHQVRHEPRRPL